MVWRENDDHSVVVRVAVAIEPDTARLGDTLGGMWKHAGRPGRGRDDVAADRRRRGTDG